jgi:hypothetical protein
MAAEMEAEEARIGRQQWGKREEWRRESKCAKNAFRYISSNLVWATKLLLAAIGLVFPALVLGYKSFKGGNAKSHA